MHASPFIFSNERKWRLRRHVAFWTGWWLFAGFIYSLGPIPFEIGWHWSLLRSCLESLAFLPLHIFLAYSLNYFIIPRYLVQGKYWKTFFLIIAAVCITSLISVVISYSVIQQIRAWFRQSVVDWTKLPNATLLYGFMAGLRGGITIAGLAAAIKLLKYYYIKEQRNLQLQKEKAEAQLQLLKAQVHPHFLFNTLNNIYSHTQGSSPIASQLVMGLSDMLRFMLYEGNQALVPLQKELKMVQDYIQLEKTRYDDHLDVQVDVPADTGDLHITPLLLLPLVENCFKHGTSNMLEQPWLSLHVHVDNTKMYMKLINGKPVDARKNGEHRAGIGIHNVRSRLELLYLNKYELQITDDADVFIVNLQIELEKRPVVKKKEGHQQILTAHE